MVAYFDSSPSAFWMSDSKPASVNAFSRAGRSPPSQRGDDAESGRMMQARAVVSPPVLPPVPEHPASSSADAEAATAIEINEDFFTSLPFLV
jgi:hypothetical protein